jgi:hypothetical protein
MLRDAMKRINSSSYLQRIFQQFLHKKHENNIFVQKMVLLSENLDASERW